MAQNNWKKLSWDKTDLAFNETLNPFYDSTDKVSFGNFLTLKKTLSDITIDTTFRDDVRLKNIGQWYYKQNDLNIFAEDSYNEYLGNAIEKRLFDDKNIVLHGNDIYNKYINYIDDLTSNLIIKLDLSSLISQFESDADMSIYIQKSADSYAKYYFSVKSITPISRKNVSYSTILNLYQQKTFQPYFDKVNTAIKSVMGLRRHLYDWQYIHKRKSFILFDFTSGAYWGIHFYDMRYDNTNKLIFKFEKHEFVFAWRHVKYNQINGITYDYLASSASLATGNDQRGNTLDTHYNFPPSDSSHSNVNIVRSSAQSGTEYNTWVRRKYDFTHDISSFTEFLPTDIKYAEINESKQHSQVDSTTWSSLYTFRVTTTEGKQFNIPFIVDLTSLPDYIQDLSIRNVIDKTKCTLFDQNELNSKYDTDWTVEQDIFDITDILSLQSYDDTLDILTINKDSIKVTNDTVSFNINSDETKILKHGNYFLNKYVLIDRNLHGIDDPQNQSCLNIMEDYPEKNIQDRAIITPFGKSDVSVTDGMAGTTRYLYSSIWNSTICGPDTASYQIQHQGSDIRYELYNTSTGVLRVYNQAKNLHSNSVTIDQSRSYKSNTQYAQGIHGIYNSLLNVIYFVERSFSSPNYPHWLTKQNLQTDTKTNLKSSNCNGGNQDISTNKQSRFVIDSTSIEMHFIPEYNNLKYFYRNKYNFSKGNFNTYTQYYYGTFWEWKYDNRILHGYPTFVNDNTMIIGDDLGNIYKVKYDLTSASSTQYAVTNHNKSKIDIELYKRLYLPAKNLMNWSMKTDHTTTWGWSWALTSGVKHASFYKITPEYFKIFPVIPYVLEEYYWFDGIMLFLDGTTWIRSKLYLTEDGQGHRQQPIFRFTIDFEDGTTSITKSYSTTPGRLSLVDIDNRLIYGMEDHYSGTYTESREIYTYNIDTLVVTKVADKFPRIAHIYSQTKDLDTGYYYFLGTNSDDTSKIIFIRCDWDADSTSQSVLNEQNIPNFPYYTSTTNSKNSLFDSCNGLYIKDTSFHGIMIPNDSPSTWKSFILMPEDDQSSVWCFYRSSLNLKDETVDLDYERMKSTGEIYPLWIDNQFTFRCLGAPFKIDRFDSDTTQVVHAKLWDDPFTQYIDSGTNVTYDDATSASVQRFMGYTLATENKHYAIYPSNKIWCYVKIKDEIYPPYTPFMNHRIIAIGDWTLETNLDAYTNGWLVDSDCWFMCRDYPTTYAVGDTSYSYRYIEQRKLDTLFNFQKIYRPTWKDSYSSGSYGTIPTSWRDEDNTDIIYLCSNSGCIYSQNQYSNELDKVNVQKGKAGSGFKTRYFGNPTKKFVVTDTSKQYSAAGTGASKCTFIYNKTRNRWYYGQGSFTGPTKLNLATTRMLFGFYCSDKYLIQPYQYSAAGYTGYALGLTTDQWGYLLGNKEGISFFCPSPPDVNRQYQDDQSNMVWTQETDRYIITKPKFYNNIFSTDICPETFDEYSDSLHTTIDDRQWAGSVGLAQYRGQYDNIYVYKLTMSASDMYVVKNFKINGELSFNYRLLQYQRHNVCVANYTQENLLNRALTTMTSNLLSDFTATDFTKIDSSTLFVDGLIKFDQTIAAYQELVDAYGTYNNVSNAPGYTTQYTTTDNTLTRKTLQAPVTCECLDSTVSEVVNFDDITSVTVSEFNDFYITLSVTDSTGNNTTINTSNPKNTFIEFGNNKVYQVARTAFFKRDIPDATMAEYPYSDLYSLFNFTIVPPAGRICKTAFRYRKDSTSINNRYYQRYYDRDATIYNYDTTVDLQYSVPLFYAHDTSIMWFANDVSNKLFSLNLGTGELVSDYTDTRVRYKKPDGTTFKIWYEEIIGDDFIRYIGILGIDGTLSEITKKDVLTNYIISNKNTNVTDFTVASNKNIIEITNGTDISISGINLGTRKQFEKINQYVDSSDIAYVSLNIRNFNSHTSDEHILIVNKTDQNWEIENKNFENFIYDESNQVSIQDIMFGIFKKSNGIVSMKESVNYPLMTDLISYYDDDAGAIKYFDYTNGLIYKLEDVVVYDGAFLWRGMSSSYCLNKKEFAICDKMYPNMFYCDDLPNVFFYPYRCKYDGTKTFGSPINYIYDETSLYLLTNFSSLVDKVKIEMDSLILVNYNKDLVDYIFELTSNDLTTVTNLIDFTGAFPYGLIALRKINKYLEYARINRFARVNFDITFVDQSNQFPNADFLYSSTGIDNSYYNPFISSTVAIQNFTTLTAMQSVGSSMYADFTDSGFNVMFPNQSYRGSLSYDNQTLLDRTGSTFELTIPPQATTESYMCIYMNPFDKRLHRTLTEDNLYFSHFKLYQSKAIVRVSITYNPKVYEIIDSGMKGQSINFSDYTYGYYSDTMKAYDQKRFLWKSHANRLYTQLSTKTDALLLIKNYNQCYGIVTGTDKTSLNLNFVDDNSTTIQSYTGNTDRTNWVSGLIFDENTDYTPFYGIFTFESNITTSYIHFLITDLHCGLEELINIDVTVQLYDSSDVLLKTSTVTNPNPNGTNTSLHTISLGTSYTFKKMRITVIKTAGEFPIKIWGLMIKNSSLSYGYPLFAGWVEGITGFYLPSYSYPYDLSNSIMLAQGGQNNGTDQTITIFAPEGILGRNQDDFTLYMNGYDGTFILLEEGTNTQQNHDSTFTDKKIIGFKIKVKPETPHAIPIISINTDNTSDNFSNDNEGTLFDAGYIKGIK